MSPIAKERTEKLYRSVKEAVAKLKGAVTVSRQFALLSVATIAVMILTASNLPSAQNENRDNAVIQHRMDMMGKEPVFPFVPITPDKLPEPVGSAWNDESPDSDAEPATVAIDEPEHTVVAMIQEPTRTAIEESAMAEADAAVESAANEAAAATQARAEIEAVAEATIAAVEAEDAAAFAEAVANAAAAEAAAYEAAVAEVAAAEAAAVQVAVAEIAASGGAAESAAAGDEIVKTVRTSNREEMHIFKKDLTALQSFRYAVQVAAIYGDEAADELVDYLSNKGYSPVIWESEDKKGRRFQRIWIGLYQDGERALKAREYYRTHEKKHAFVTPVAWDSVD